MDGCQRDFSRGCPCHILSVVMGTATIPRGGGTAAPAKGLPNQPGNPNEIKPFQRPSLPPPAQSPPATPPPSSEIKPFQRPSAPPAAAPQNEIRPFQRPSTPSPGQQPPPSPINRGLGSPRGRLGAPIDTSGTDRAFQRGLDSAKSRSDELDRLYPPLDPSKSKYSPKYEQNPPPGGGANWYDDLERRGTLDRAKEAAKRAWDNLWNPAGSKQKKPGINPGDDDQPVEPVGRLGQYVRVTYGFRTWDGVTGEGSRGGVAPFRGIFWTVDLGTGQKVGHMQFEGYSEWFANQQVPDRENPTKYDTKFWIIRVTPWPDGDPIPFTPAPVPDDSPSPIDYGLMPNGLPAPTPARPPVPAPKPRPRPRSPQPSPKPAPRRKPTPKPAPKPAPAPAPDGRPSPAPAPYNPPGPGPAPANPNPSPTTTASPNISPKDGRQKEPNLDPNEAPDPPQEPEMNCKDPCIGSIQEEQQKAKEDRDKKKPVKITVDVFKDCEGENGAARFEKKEISVPADEADHLKLLYQQLAAANALECRLDLSVAVPEEQIRRRPKFLPEMVLFFETVRKQSNGKRSNYSMTVFHWDKPKGVKPSIPNHTKGNHIKIVTLTDGCRLSTSGKTKQEANKIMVAVLRNVPNNLKKGRGFTTKYTTSFNAKNKEVEVRCVRGKFYGSGYQPGLRPDWEIDYRKRRTTKLD